MKTIDEHVDDLMLSIPGIMSKSQDGVRRSIRVALLAVARDQREKDARLCDDAAAAARQEASDDVAYTNEAEASSYQAVMAESLAVAIRRDEVGG